MTEIITFFSDKNNSAKKWLKLSSYILTLRKKTRKKAKNLTLRKRRIAADVSKNKIFILK